MAVARKFVVFRKITNLKKDNLMLPRKYQSFSGNIKLNCESVKTKNKIYKKI